MPLLDRYLDLLKAPNAEFLRFRSDANVEISIGGQARMASKTPATSAQISQIFSEVLPADFVQRAQGKPVDFPYNGAAGPTAITVLANGTALQVTVKFGQVSTPVAAPAIHAMPAQAAAVPAAAAPVSQHHAEEAPVDLGPPTHMNDLFDQMLKVGASDLHLKSNRTPMVRVHGEMAVLPGRPAISAEGLEALLMAIMPERNQEQYRTTKDTDFAYQLPSGSRMRANVFKDIAGIGGVFRQIPSKILSVKDLNIPASVVKMTDYPKGLVLVTGPTGSGKSTTLASLIDHLNASEPLHMITIEDPVEFVHPDKKSLMNQREVGVSTMGFKPALRAALREDPDVVLVGELRDLETTEIAIETAETGHLVFGTLHTNTAAATVDRMINQFPADRQEQIRLMLSTSLIGVVSQTLCRKKGGGRVAALEILVVTGAVANLIREGKTFQIPSVMQTGRAQGMQTLCDALIDLVKADKIEPAEAYSCAADKKEMATALTRNGFRGAWSEVASGN